MCIYKHIYIYVYIRYIRQTRIIIGFTQATMSLSTKAGSCAKAFLILRGAANRFGLLKIPQDTRLQLQWSNSSRMAWQTNMLPSGYD